MKDNIPLIYWTFRTAWTLLHFLIVAAAAAALLIWALTDDHAVRAFEPAKDNVLNLQQRVSNAIPWPWATGDQHDAGDYSQSAPSPQGRANGQAERYQVLGNAHVRAAPRLNAKVVKTLVDGTWIRINCIAEGPSVDPGPYKTRVAPYQGQDYGATTNWDHIPGLGYISDAYVSTENGGGLLPC